MIKINGILIEQEQFGDGTLKCKPTLCFELKDGGKYIGKRIYIQWYYDNDAELFTVIALRDFLREMYPTIPVGLTMPYIPHARQDRFVSGRLFTLKSFAKIINSLGFFHIEAFDPHSDVSEALFDNISCPYDAFYVPYGDATVMFPDVGAAKKYSSVEYYPDPIIGIKHRNDEGRIDHYELMNFKEGTKKVFIRDDICSYGGTFVAAAKELRKRGVEEIHLVVTHCENNILKGEVLDYVDKVWTTDSIFTAQHPKIFIAKKFREEEVPNA